MNKDQAQHDAQVGGLKDDLKKLAEIFSLDLEQLFEQFLVLRSNGCSSCNADCLGCSKAGGECGIVIAALWIRC